MAFFYRFNELNTLPNKMSKNLNVYLVILFIDIVFLYILNKQIF